MVRLRGYLYAIYFGVLGVSTKASFNRAGEESAAWRPEFLRYAYETYSSKWLKVQTIEELPPVASFETQRAFSFLVMEAVTTIEELSSVVSFVT